MIGRIVSADTTTAPTPIAAAMPSLPISGIPITSRPAIATITIRPAATTEDAGRGGGLRRRVAHAVAGRHLLAEAADDQQRVVDARAEAEHHRDHGREGRQAERLRPARPAGSARRPRRSARRRAWRPSPPASGTAASAARSRSPTPTSSPTGASCSEARSMRMPRAATLDAAALGGLGGLHERLAVRPSRGPAARSVADVDRRQPARRCDSVPPLANGSSTTWTPFELADLVERAGDRGARAGVGDLALLDGEDERRVGAGEGGAVLLEEVERLLRLRARDVEVVGRLAARAGGCAEQHDDDDRAGEAALPVVGEGAGEPREQ